MKKKIKIKAICGKAGSGKDTILREVIEAYPHFAKIINCTTRPKRENEADGVDYHFIDISEFTRRMLDTTMLEASVFNEWCYGTAIEDLDWDKTNIGVFNPTGIEILKEDRRVDLTVYYLQASDKTRLLRQLNREENPDVHEIIRRFSADDKDFNMFPEYCADVILDNETVDDKAFNIRVIGEDM